MVTINERGDVVNAWIISSDHKVLDNAALDAAFKFKFSPAKQKGLRAKASIGIPFRFSLTD